MSEELYRKTLYLGNDTNGCHAIAIVALKPTADYYWGEVGIEVEHTQLIQHDAWARTLSTTFMNIDDLEDMIDDLTKIVTELRDLEDTGALEPL